MPAKKKSVSKKTADKKAAVQKKNVESVTEKTRADIHPNQKVQYTSDY